MREKKFKIFFNEESGERVVGRCLDTMLDYQEAKLINRGCYKGRMLMSFAT
jgi:hypothetical protein